MGASKLPNPAFGRKAFMAGCMTVGCTDNELSRRRGVLSGFTAGWFCLCECSRCHLCCRCCCSRCCSCCCHWSCSCCCCIDTPAATNASRRSVSGSSAVSIVTCGLLGAETGPAAVRCADGPEVLCLSSASMALPLYRASVNSCGTRDVRNSCPQHGRHGA